ncbi:hypothetical protein Ndes2526B_g07788 [Nannochloris sp. 'desiccata']
MKNTTSLMALFGAILLLLACTAQSRQEPLGRRLSQAGAVASGSGDSVSTSTRTESSDRDAAVVEGTTEMPSTVVDGKQSCHCHWDCYNLAQLAYYLALQLALGMPRPPTKIPIRRRKEVKIIIVPPKPVPEIPVCKGKIKEACCDSKDYCPWNWQWYPDKEPPKICKVEVEVIKEFKLCQWPVLVWKDEYDYTCKCPETPDPCPYCDVCFVQSSASAFARADAFASSGYLKGYQISVFSALIFISVQIVDYSISSHPRSQLKRLLGSLLTVLYRVKSEVVKNIDLLSYETKITSNQFCFPLHQKKDKI